jgi:hypothetical protein
VSDQRRPTDPDAIDPVVRKYAAAIGMTRGHSVHSMRASIITTALENGAQLEDVQKVAGHRDPGATKLYDRLGYNPEKASRSSRPTDLSGLTAAQLRVRRFESLSLVQSNQCWLLIKRFSGGYGLESDEGNNHPAGAARKKGRRKRPPVNACATGG